MRIEYLCTKAWVKYTTSYYKKQVKLPINFS